MASVIQTHERECTVCKDDFTTPKILPCGHLLCRECVISRVDSKPNAGCPLCTCSIVEHRGSSSQTSADVVDALPTDSVMEVIVELASMLASVDLCTVCDDVRAEFICMQCFEKMCPSCMKIHKKMVATCSHEVESLSTVTPERLAASRPALCADHEDSHAELFCVSHNLVICTSCFSNKHNKCPNVKPLDEKMKSAKDVLESFTEQLAINKAIRSLTRHIEAVDEIEQENLAAVDKTCDELQKMVKECRKQLKKLTSDSFSMFKKSLCDIKGDLEKRLGKVTSHKHIVTRTTTVRNRHTLIQAAKSLTDRVHSLDLSTELEPYAWVNPSPEITKCCDSVLQVIKDELQKMQIEQLEVEEVSSLCKVT